ncbi:hypothetical protein PFISCL1PPCAC_9855 [Pristionchus fissidentatus]|uniref:MADF domain-containing protein n=1 Tax=Pristionchus fissidentatus TaxID=1538716 RepID=A0AAV5VGV4_9BILA|nr:hypothetical protein PFISCL1PPCAC_9855 [Pristionchus fissidentatus]
MSTSAQQRRGRGGSVADFGSASAEYQLTELKNVSSARTQGTNSAEFNIRLVQAVREHPAFYDAGDEHFGNRHQDAQHRAAAWQQVAASLGYSGDVHSLSQQWRKLKDKYSKDRRKGATTGEDLLDDSLAAEMSFLDEFVLDNIPAGSSSASAPSATDDNRQMYFMEGDEDLLGDDFVDEEFRMEDGAARVDASPAGSAHSGTGSDIDVGGSAGPSSSGTSLTLKDLPPPPNTSRPEPGGGGTHGTPGTSRSVTMHTARVPVSSGSSAGPQSFRFVSSASHQPHLPEGITVGSRGNGTLIAHPTKREGSIASGGSTLTMVIDPTTYYQNGTQKMYRLVNVADLDQSQHLTLQHPRQGGGGQMMAEPTGGISIGRGTRKRMGAPLSPPSHVGGSGMSSLAPPSTPIDHASPYGKHGSGQLGDDLILDDGIVGENTIVIDHQRDDDSPLLVDSPGMHHQHMMMGGSRGMHRGQHSPTLLGNGSGMRGPYSPGGGNSGGMRIPNTSNPFSTSQYDADLALQHFISSHLARMNEDDKALAKMNIQRILLDARFGAGTTMRVCMGEEDAELTDAAVASELVSG